jgi:Ca2+/H+ antiporter, TMEM165/GDT1 family
MELAFVGGFLLVFAVVGGFELFDRTSFALIALSSRNRPLPSWAGGALAFVLTSALAVSVGAALVAALGPGRIGLLRVGAGSVLIGYAVWLYFHSEPETATEVKGAHSAFVAAFLTIFLLELGDTTMILEILFVSDWGWLVVFLGGGLALVLVAGWDVLLGSKLGSRVDERTLDRIVVVVLTIVGALTIAYGLAPGAFPTLGSLAAPGR